MSRSTIALLLVMFALSCQSRESTPQVDSTTKSDSAPVTAAAAVDSGAPRLLPVDGANASFRDFRERALNALSRRDTAFLHGMLSPDIRTSFGSAGGIADFKEMWKTSDPKSSVWQALSRVLRMGGKLASDSMFMAPYVYAFWPDSIDAFAHAAVTGVGAAVRSRPDSLSDILGSATHSILRVLEWSSMPQPPIATDTTWARVLLPDNRSGWMRASDVYSPVGWRAAFARRGDQWVMILFVAGD